MQFFKKTDMIIILGILAISMVSWLVYHFVFSEEPAKAEIYYYSELVKTVELNAGVEQTFTIKENENVVFHQSKDGSICFEASDCPDKVCVKSGKLSTVGQYAACLPNGIALKIIKTNHGDEEIDMIVGN